MKHRVHLGMERWSAQSKGMSALKVGQHVTIQNQRGAGKIAKRWDRTGVVVEDLGHNKYRVRIDGSGRVTDRNRQFLRLFKPATFTYSPGITQTTREVDPHPLVGDGQEVHPVAVPEAVNAPVAPPPPDTAATPDVQTPHVEHSPYQWPTLHQSQSYTNLHQQWVQSRYLGPTVRSGGQLGLGSLTSYMDQTCTTFRDTKYQKPSF